jgi:hypothetical protein
VVFADQAWLLCSNFKTQCDRTKGVMTELFVKLAGSPDPHQCQPDAMPGNKPLATDTDCRLSDPWSPADTVAAAIYLMWYIIYHFNTRKN